MSQSVTVIHHEASLVARWLSRGSGLMLALAFSVLASLEIITTIYSGRLDGLRYGLALNLAISLEISAITFAVVAWIYFLWRRTLAFFRPVRLADILVTPLRPEDLFPALLMGPTVLAMTFAALWEFLVLTIPPLMGEKHYLLHLYLRPAESMSAQSLWWIQILTVARVPLLILEAGAVSLAFGAVAAYFMLPRGGALRLVIVLLLLQALLVPEIYFSLWVDDAAVSTGAVGERNQLVCDHVLGPAMTIILCGAVVLGMLRLLRGDAFWRRLRLQAAKV